MPNTLASKAPCAQHANVFTKSALSVYEVEQRLHCKLGRDCPTMCSRSTHLEYGVCPAPLNLSLIHI